MTYIFYSFISENNHKKLMQEFLLRFPLDFQKKIMGYRRWQDAQLSLLGRILLYKGADNFSKKYKKANVKYNKYKKPYFEEDKIYFNISHSGEIVVCAVTDVSDIGIDIELQCDIQIEDFQLQMTKGEWAKIFTSINKLDSFYGYWTQKEAVIKNSGKGLSVPLKSFEILEDVAIIEGKTFFLKEIKLHEKYKCHIATCTLLDETSIKILELDPSNDHAYLS